MGQASGLNAVRLQCVRQQLCARAACLCRRYAGGQGSNGHMLPRVTLVLLQVAAALVQRCVVRKVHVLAGAVRPERVEVPGPHQAHLPHVERRGAAC
jgi:hypothetical protein